MSLKAFELLAIMMVTGSICLQYQMYYVTYDYNLKHLIILRWVRSKMFH